MAIRSPCKCGYVYFAPIQEAGTNVVCPGCRNQLSIPVESDDDDDPFGLSESPTIPSGSIGLGPPMKLDSISDISLSSTEGAENEAASDPSEHSVDDANGSEDPESGISLVDDAPRDEPSLDESAGAEDHFPVMASLVDEPTECPSCGSSMSPRSVLCLHCGYDRRSGRRLRTRAGSERLAQAKSELEEEASEVEAALKEGLSKNALFSALGALALFMLLSWIVGPAYSVPLAGLLLVPGGATIAVIHAMGGGAMKTVVLGVVLSFVGVLMFCCGGVMLHI